jgi:hypothetical protein
MMRTFGVKAWTAGLTLAAMASACGGPVEAPDPAPEVAGDPAAAPLTPVATLALGNGNMLEVYDLKSGAVISETGPAGVTPIYNPKQTGDATQLVSIWKAMAPQKPVPQALSDLQARLSALPPDVAEATPVLQLAGGTELAQREPARRSGDLLAAPSGCNNGCCDYEWLATLDQCQHSGTYSWFLYNYGYSYSNHGGVDIYRGLVCSAEGTSTYRVAVRGGGGTWSIPEGYYRTYFWFAGTTCNPFCHYASQTVSSGVNSSGDQHLHTYCGNFTY